MSKWIRSIWVTAAVLVATSASASAADLYDQAANYDGGFYVGVVGGYGWGEVDAQSEHVFSGIVNQTVTGRYSLDGEGALLGGQVGYDWILADGMFVGAVGDFLWSDAGGSLCVEGPCAGGQGYASSYADSSVDWLATVRAKVGYVVGHAQIYGTGGLALAEGSTVITNLIGTADTATDSKTHIGWTIGAGAVYKFSQNISVGAEYLYANFGSEYYNLPADGLDSDPVVSPQTAVGGVDASFDMHMVRGSLNFHF